MGQTDIHAAGADGSNEVNLTRGSGLDAFLPRWSPDGGSIVYTAGPRVPPHHEHSIRLGVTSIVLQVALLLGPLLWLASRFALPPGAYMLLITVALSPSLVLQDTYRLAPAVIGAGVLADVLGAWLQPRTSRTRLRLFAFAVPTALVGGYLAALRTEAPIEWTVHLWAAAIVLAGVVGLLLALLVSLPSAASAPD